MTQENISLSESLKDCKYPLKIVFTIDRKKNIHCLTVSYSESFPAIARYEEVPNDLTQAVLDLLPEFDISHKNKELSKRNLRNNGERKVKPIESTSGTNKQTKKTPKKVKFAKSLI
ncbi:hypothetical protein C7B62_20840 [Pleurocapsa sp. CCALA 161]|uniref:hypothetical protein n=1 Tax=Pleurocapsa sp. CCALA 161 TaxID=2107688 RepID=UPI000D059C37|nr:hypothetical protein [Pleurocapsa sp. CCALA 161]PSB07118.1 hypothetical protein C7B62_20840 [Pleurocapsa sp. CCALA 161]